MMNPTPEQFALAYAMLTLGRDGNDKQPTTPATKTPSTTIFRLVAIVIVGFATGLLGLSYIDGNIATSGRSEAEIRSFGEPSPQFALAVEAGDKADQQIAEETASAR